MPDASLQTVLIENAGESISVAVKFKARKQLSISVHPDGSVTALAPLSRSLEEVQAHLNRRLRWIDRQRNYFAQYHPRPVEKRFLSGETHLYLGRQYRLRVHRSKNTVVKLVGKYFEVDVPAPKKPKVVATALRQWYQWHAEAVFCGRLAHCLRAASSLKLDIEMKLRVRSMKRRWGSCSKAGVITLNTDLVKTPLHCIDYVIIHELCHLRIHDHSPAFFRLLERYLPDWRRRKERLDSMVLR